MLQGTQWNRINVHGAGSQRSDPKVGDPRNYPRGRGPQGDDVRIFNYVRPVRGGIGTSLEADRYTLPAASGGALTFVLDAGSSHAGRNYIVAGSLSGTKPGSTVSSLTVPLKLDAFSWLTIALTNTPMFSGFGGTLDGSGRAVARFDTRGPLAVAARRHVRRVRVRAVSSVRLRFECSPRRDRALSRDSADTRSLLRNDPGIDRCDDRG